MLISFIFKVTIYVGGFLSSILLSAKWEHQCAYILSLFLHTPLLHHIRSTLSKLQDISPQKGKHLNNFLVSTSKWPLWILFPLETCLLYSITYLHGSCLESLPLTTMDRLAPTWRLHLVLLNNTLQMGNNLGFGSAALALMHMNVKEGIVLGSSIVMVLIWPFLWRGNYNVVFSESKKKLISLNPWIIRIHNIESTGTEV